MLGEAACARDRMGQQREGPTSARTIRVHRLPPFRRDARGRQATRLRALLPAGTNRVTPEETNVREKEIPGRDRKSTRLNSSHGYISYAVFCLKKKTNRTTTVTSPKLRRNTMTSFSIPKPAFATLPYLLSTC